MQKYIFLAILGALALSFSGCGPHKAYDTARHPWAEAPSWEQQEILWTQNKPKHSVSSYPIRLDSDYKYLHTDSYDHMQHDNFRHPHL